MATGAFADALYPASNPFLYDKFRGVILGSAIGDAIGTTLEFKPRKSIKHPLTDMVGGGPFSLRPGQFTDDTSMALCLAESLLFKGRHDPHAEMDRYVAWLRKGHMSPTARCFDIGITTRESLERYKSLRSHCKDREAFLANPEFAYTNPCERAGNGSLMRLAPVPLFFYNASADDCAKVAALTSLTTHSNVECAAACAYYALLVREALAESVITTDNNTLQAQKEALFNRVAALPVIDTLAAPKIVSIAKDQQFKSKTEDQISSSGYVVHSLEAALWCFYTTSTYDEGVLQAANLGDDADTVACIHGILAGAFYGASRMRDSWVQRIAMRGLLESISAGLYAAATQDGDGHRIAMHVIQAETKCEECVLADSSDKQLRKAVDSVRPQDVTDERLQRFTNTCFSDLAQYWTRS
jgi:ADP-ribosyl-[dinitrogen reductase] hydrolase